MKVLFIQENGMQESLGITSLSAFLKTHDHDVELILVSHEKNLLDAIRKINPTLIAFSALTGIHKPIVQLAHEIKKMFNIPIIVGGPHTTHYPEMVELDPIDMICRGEGEEALLELMDRLSNSEPITDIQNLWVKQNGKIYKNPIRLPIEDIDALPLPDREIYYTYDFLRNMTIKRFISGVGCPYNCTFCHNPQLKKEYRELGYTFIRKKSVFRVIKEILAVKEKYPLKIVHFSDDLFLSNKKWFREFSHHYPKDVGIPYTCSIRFDSVDEEIAQLLKSSLCHGVQVGLESGDEYLRNTIINKVLPEEKIFSGAKLLRQAGITILTTNIIGLPGETLEMALKTIALNSRIKVHYARANTFMAFPKVEIIKYAKEHGYLDDEYSVEDYVPEPQHITFKTPYENEFRNLCSFFFLMVKLPFLKPIFSKLLFIRDNVIFRLIGAICNMYQEVRFFRVGPFVGWKFFKNTILVRRGRSALQWIPRVRSRT